MPKAALVGSRIPVQKGYGFAWTYCVRRFFVPCGETIQNGGSNGVPVLCGKPEGACFCPNGFHWYQLSQRFHVA